MLSSPSFLTRIAPTPSGYLHRGNAFSFVLSWLWSRKMGGRLLLRIDDCDVGRSRTEFIEDIFYTLEWLGIDYDLGPGGPDDFQKNYSQLKRLDLYASVLKSLKGVPGLLYACKCSRKEISAANSGGIYPGFCKEKEIPFDSEDVAWRIRVPEVGTVDINEWGGEGSLYSLPIGDGGDFVVRRKDGLPAYQITSLVDDIHYGVNFIIRGKDLLGSTAAQLYLAECLNGTGGRVGESSASFLRAGFFHHPLLLDAAGHKLSKSKGAESVHQMRTGGKSPQEIYRMVAELCGLPDNSSGSLSDLLDAFQPSALGGLNHS